MKIRLLKVFLCYLFILLSLYCIKPASAETYPNRISLAVSGGASKGAYEAGLIWGLIEVMRQVEKTENWAFGGEPRPIQIASIAGTSAGGINTLLAAMVWSVNPEDKGGFTNRLNDNIFRDVWLTPDVNRLLPLNADPRQYFPGDALLSRKDLVDAARELRKKWRQPGTFRPGIRLPLGVTVTRVKPETMIVRGVAVDNQRFYIPFEIRTQDDGSVKFFFDPHDYPSLTDPAMIIMPWPADGSPFFISDQQVETALLTTSAFPTGFGRKRLQYCRQKMTSKNDEITTTPSMEGSDNKEKELVCPDGYELTEAEFADGGLFDNLPIGLARLLSESSTLHKKEPLPIKYIYLDPNRERYETPVSEDKRACEGQDPPEACGELTFDIASEAVVLGGAIGTARKYELYRELTSDNWKLNLSQLAYSIADIMDADELDVECPSALIMDDPEYWSHEMVKRLTRRSVYLDKQAKAIYRAREPDPEKRDKAYTTLMGAGALVLRTATYKYPKFTFSPSTAPEDWIWRNIIPYETALDGGDGDLLFFWQPTCLKIGYALAWEHAMSSTMRTIRSFSRLGLPTCPAWPTGSVVKVSL